ncbi:MAG: SIMPL domain-containing protein [Chloroflexia bacterium]|nr:SIMPL domain-containing protein [Chloroflexia bacterium]
MKDHLNSIIIGLAIIIAIGIVSTSYKNRNRANDIINVTGLGERDFTSDLIVWSASFSKKRYDLPAAYEALKTDRQLVVQYLSTKKIKAEDVVFSAVSIDKEFNYTYDEKGNQRSEFTGYRLTQKVEIESKDVDKIEAMSRQITQLINNGVELSSNRPEYYYTKLAELKVEMIAAATEDATLRAKKIAENAGAQVGDLRYAQMGIFQIVAQNSSEEYTWGGAFNTSSKQKTATITMKLQFGIK